MKRILLLVAVALSTALGAAAQNLFADDRFGADPAKREENAKIFTYMQFAYNTKAYDDALMHFRKLLVDAPKASMNMYIWAAEIYRGKIAKATSKAERNAYLDTVMMVFDNRIKYFGDHEKYDKAYLAAQKALLYSEINPTDDDNEFRLFREAINVGKGIDPDLPIAFFSSITESFKLDDLTPEAYISEYQDLVTVLGKYNDEGKFTKTIETIDALFATSGAANCENIEKIFKPKYEAEPNNGEQVKKILGLLTRNKCTGPFPLQVAEAYYKIDPSPEMAGMLAAIYENNKDFAKASEYLKIAIAGEKDPNRKLGMLLGAASTALGDNQYREAADLARQAIAIDDQKAAIGYLIVASAYAGGVQSCSGFERKAAYWLVADMYAQARAKLADQPDQVEQINRSIASCAANFPKVEETFQRDLSPGQGYTVNCGWVSGRTTVRER